MMRETHIKLTSDVTIGLITDLLEKHYGELGYSIENIEAVKKTFVDAILNKHRKSERGRPSDRNHARPRSGGRTNNEGIFGKARGGSIGKGRGVGKSSGPVGNVGKGSAPYGNDRSISVGGGSLSRSDEPVRDFIGDNVFLTVELSDTAKKRASEEFYEDIVEKINEPLRDTSGDILIDFVEATEEKAVSIFEDVANDLDVTTEEIAKEFAENAGLSDGGKL